MPYLLDENLCRFTAAREAFVSSVYPDKHHLAWGFGENDPGLELGQSTTIEDSIPRLVAKLRAGLRSLARTLGDAPLPQHAVNALASLQYNIGAGSLADLTGLVQAVKAYSANPTALHDVVEGILGAYPRGGAAPFNLSRRQREVGILASGDYGDLRTLLFWDKGLNPHVDHAAVIPMPTFLKGEP